MDDHPFRDGAKAALPVVLGYLPVGMAFGVLSQKAGLTAFEVAMMSFLVYAGASQFIAVEMVSILRSWFFLSSSLTGKGHSGFKLAFSSLPSLSSPLPGK